jgi:NAD(P)-dependent dehydrogenase (short-subunit alcohol dehydrogenase family)
MDIAIVTGAETPLGIRLIKGLIQQGCRVHGIGNNFANVTYADPNFIAHPVDLSDLTALRSTAERILEQSNRLDILIHAIDVTPGAAFEKLPVGNLEAILKIGLLGPVMLTRLMLPNLLRFRGQLINILPTNKSGQAASAANALIEGGLRSMNAALFDQGRDVGLRVTNLILKQNVETNPSATPEMLAQSRIDPEHVARVVEKLLDPNEPNVPSELVLHPRLSPEATEDLPNSALPLDPYAAVVLPPKEYCPPEQPKIPTKEKENIDRTIPYTDDEMEDKIAAAIEDFEAHPERYENTPTRPKQPAQNQAKQDNSPKNTDPSNDNQSGNARRRGRRRGGRNRNKPRPDQAGPDENSNKQTHPKQSNADNAPSPAKADTSNPNQQGQPSAKKPSRNRNRNRNRSRDDQPKPDGNVHNKPKSPAPVPQKPVPAASKPSKKPVAKKAAKKVAKKAVKKIAQKKAAKKAVKKTATKKAVKKAKPAKTND